MHEETEEWEHTVHPTGSILVDNGSTIHAGDQLTEGPLNPQDIMRILGLEATHRYLVNEVQKVYRAQFLWLSYIFLYKQHGCHCNTTAST